ncbi:MAG: peptidyl-tRNA hydrolase [Methanophagales archaeon ANME-1-THS]|nr:MAG: peptidyl-tRNA hydrolase [Methanophagales archaeon ANME-1-THS]
MRTVRCNPHEEYKQCIVLRDDLKLSKGKAAAQAAHASLLSYERAPVHDRKQWKAQGQKKVVLKVENLGDLYSVREEAEKLGLPSALVEDAGLTEIPPGTVTALGIGPARADAIDKVTGHLELL